MSNVLDEILANKHAEVERARVERPIAELQNSTGFMLPRRNFYGAVAAPRRSAPNLIAEVKRASPSAGVIAADFDPVTVAERYVTAGVQALSVLTDEKFFGGRLAFIDQIKVQVGLPVLRKDFLIDEYQVYESRAAGADAVLLIAEALQTPQLVRLVHLARTLELCVLLEVHSRDSLISVLNALGGEPLRGGLLLGINNRDLKTQRVDLATTEGLVSLVPPGWPVVAESGIRVRDDVVRMFSAGARAVLVGEALMRSTDVAATVRQLFG